MEACALLIRHRFSDAYFFVFLVSGGQGGGYLAGPSRMKPLGGNLQKSWEKQGTIPPPWKSDIDTKNDGFKTNLRLQIWRHFGHPY